ncbi:MAG: capsule assembly Wzi family protein [Woeseiaceae bacterium]
MWLLVIILPAQGAADPTIQPGDIGLRADIQLLADRGIISGPVTTWPLSWGPVAADILAADLNVDPGSSIYQAYLRVRARAQQETRTDQLLYRANLSLAEEPVRIRGFADTPREAAEIGAGVSWTGNWLTLSLNGQVVDDASDGERYRADGSSIAALLGNFSVSANTLDRWWGPGWDGSLILSNNARPIPSISIDRNFTDAFESKWLSWLGPWDLAVHYGQFETDRQIPNARFFGLRFNFKPIPALEIGLSRTAQWCGDSRPCGLDTFIDLLFGNDNQGEQGIGADNEPGNQLAGIDFRWAHELYGLPFAIYGQVIGEDEAGGFPSRYLGQFGVESHGNRSRTWQKRWFAEFAATSCRFHRSTELFNCAYNHGVYETGYRYRGRSVGHAADNDARIASTGILLMHENGTEWEVLLRFGALNRGGSPDSRNSLTPTRRDFHSFDISYGKTTGIGRIEIGAGLTREEDVLSGTDKNRSRAYLAWNIGYPVR